MIAKKPHFLFGIFTRYFAAEEGDMAIEKKDLATIEKLLEQLVKESKKSNQLQEEVIKKLKDTNRRLG